MIDETIALSARALKKWIRNPAAVLPGLFTSIFYLVLFGNSFNPTNLFTAGLSGTLPPSVIATIKQSILQNAFGGAPTYITYLTAGGSRRLRRTCSRQGSLGRSRRRS